MNIATHLRRFALVAALAAATVAFSQQDQPAPSGSTVRIGEHTYTAEQLRDVLDERQLRMLEEGRMSDTRRRDGPPQILGVPFGWLLGGTFVFIVTIVGAGMLSENAKDRRRHETLRVFAEKGAAPPRDLLEKTVEKGDPFALIIGGAVNLVVGAVITVVFQMSNIGGPALIGGLIPLGIGVVLIIFGIHLQRRRDAARRDNP